MRRASSFRDGVAQVVEWLEDREVLQVCDNLWAAEDQELGYVPELKK